MRSCFCASIFLLAGCQFNGSEKGTDGPKGPGFALDSLTLDHAGYKDFDIDSSTNYNTLYLTVYHDPVVDKRFLVYQNENTNSIQFYDFDSELLHKEIHFPKFGPNGIPGITGFYIHGPDSVYVLSANARKLYLCNGYGQIQSTITLLNGDESKNTGKSMITTSNDAFVIGDFLYLNSFPDRSPYYEGFHTQVVNLKTGKYKFEGQFPLLYREFEGWDKMAVRVHRCYNQNDSLIIESHMAIADLIVKNPFSGQRNTYYAGSRYFENSSDIKEKDRGWTYHYLTLNYYRQIIWDPYRKLYYRIASRAVDLENNPNSRIENKALSVIILDRSFKKLGEADLPEHLYFFRTMFVEKEGLYIATTNYQNPDLDEDKIVFGIFTAIPKSI